MDRVVRCAAKTRGRTGAKRVFTLPDVAGSGIVFAAGAAWVLSTRPPGLVELDPATGKELARVAIPLSPNLKHGVIDAWSRVKGAFDAHRRDPLANLNLGEEDYAWVTARLMDVAGRKAGGRIVSVLEGGYDLQALASSAATHVAQLMEG